MPGDGFKPPERWLATQDPFNRPQNKMLVRCPLPTWNVGVMQLAVQPEFFVEARNHPHPVDTLAGRPLEETLKEFREFGAETRILSTPVHTPGGRAFSVPTFVNEFWTARQRQASRLHEISYRACFKPQLPRFFIGRLTVAGDVVYDPFMGRGTTLVEAALSGRIPCGCDVNPLSRMLVRPRLNPPSAEEVARRLDEISLNEQHHPTEDLLAFYHPTTLRQLCSLRAYLLARQADGSLDRVDEWIWMVAINRLTGHSSGFFSVYTLPPNQATSARAQRRINEKRRQAPPPRDVVRLILRKTRQLLAGCDGPTLEQLSNSGARGQLLTGPAMTTPEIATESIALVVTSPPFLDVVDYAGDNWLRCWFIGVDPSSVPMSIHRRLEDWQCTMTNVLRELHRVLRVDGHVAFEVGEVRGGRVTLEDAVVSSGVEAGFVPRLIVINDQRFTKTANCWGVANNTKGTNTNRIVLFKKA